MKILVESSENHKGVYDVSTKSLSRQLFGANVKKPLKVDLKEPLMKCRYMAVLMGFAAEFFLFANRIVLSVSIVSMVNNAAVSDTEEGQSISCLGLITNATTEDYNPSMNYRKALGEFDWSPTLQGYLLGCSSIFYTVATIPAAKLTEMFGCKKVLFWGCFLSSLLTFASPLAAWCHIYVLILVQGLRGAFQASIVPAEAVLMANWCPKSERSLLYSIVLSGACWGAVLCSYFSGLLCELTLLRGWPLSFFVIGGTGSIVSLFMGYYMHDNPSIHPSISQAELMYILENQENVLTKTRPTAPWSSILTSVPVYAFAFALFGQTWALAQFLVIYPTFLATILHYSVNENGLFSALPFLLQFVTSIVAGWSSSLLEMYISINMSRKFWNSVACLGYSACLLGVYFAGCNRCLSIMFGIASLAFTGFAHAGCWITPADMSPTFAASVNAVSSLSFTSSFFLPVLSGHLTNGMQTIEQWNKVFFISIGVVMSSGVVFAVFGSAEVQPWNDVSKNLEDQKTSSIKDKK